jgi:hypothetical protein
VRRVVVGIAVSAFAFSAVLLCGALVPAAARPGVRGRAAPTIEELYGTLRLATATTPNIVRVIEKRPSRAAA